MKIAFDVDVLAKQMDINRMVHQVADWGYKYIEQSPHPRSIRSINIRCFLKSVNRNTDRLCGKPAWRFLPLSSYTAGPAQQRNRDSLQLPTGSG